jgi:protein-S-isoprenylcysteine O-methyltransferase Ste14
MDIMADYGLWQLVIVNSLIILIFAFGFFQPQTKRDWRTFGAFSAFVVALFTEMYGFPLTIYLLSGWLTSRFPEINWFSHNSSHLLQTLLGWSGDAHSSPLHIISDILVLGGLILLAASWKVLYRAQRNYEIACSGPYAKIRHPQYTAFDAADPVNVSSSGLALHTAGAPRRKRSAGDVRRTVCSIRREHPPFHS